MKSSTQLAARGPGRPARSQERDVRAALLEAAHSLFLRYGYRGVSARQVAGRAGVAPAMVQYYFGSKHGLCAAMLEEAIGPLVQKIEQVLGGPAREHVDLAGKRFQLHPAGMSQILTHRHADGHDWVGLVRGLPQFSKLALGKFDFGNHGSTPAKTG